MTQPPRPSAAALAFLDEHHDGDDWWLTEEVALLLDAFAAQAVAAAEEASRYEFAPGSHDGGAPWTGQPTAQAAERSKPAANDIDPDDADASAVERIAGALAERGRVERERATKMSAPMPPQ